MWWVDPDIPSGNKPQFPVEVRFCRDRKLKVAAEALLPCGSRLTIGDIGFDWGWVFTEDDPPEWLKEAMKESLKGLF